MHKVSVAERLEIKINEFLGKVLLWGFCGKISLEWTYNEVFQVLSEINTLSFTDFLHEVTVAFGFLAILELGRTWNDPKIKLIKF